MPAMTFIELLTKAQPDAGSVHIPSADWKPTGRKRKKAVVAAVDAEQPDAMPCAKSFSDMADAAFAYRPKQGAPKLNISDAAHVAGACAALSAGGFRGQKVQIPAAALAGVKAKVRAAWRKFNPHKTDADMPASIKESR